MIFYQSFGSTRSRFDPSVKNRIQASRKQIPDQSWIFQSFAMKSHNLMKYSFFIIFCSEDIAKIVHNYQGKYTPDFIGVCIKNATIDIFLFSFDEEGTLSLIRGSKIVRKSYPNFQGTLKVMTTFLLR